MNASTDSKSSFTLIFLLWVAGLGAATQFAKIAVLFPDVQKLYPNLGSESGLLVSLIGFLGIVFGLFAGLLVARIGYKRLIVFALVLGGVISIIQTLPLSFELMLASRFIEGISHLIIVVAAPTLIALVSSDHQRGFAMTLWSTFFGVAFAIMAWLGIPFSQAYGVKTIFLIHGVVMLLTAAILFARLPAKETKADAAIFSLSSVLGEHIRAYRSPNISAPAIGWLFYTLTFVSLLTVLPTLVDTHERAIVAGMMPIVSIVVSLVMGKWLLPKFKAVDVVIMGFVLSAGIVCMVWAGAGLAYISILLFASLGLIQGASFAAIPQLNAKSENQALANGAMAQMGNLGNTLGTPLFLVLLTSFDINGMIVGAIICYVLGMALHIFLARRRGSGITSPE